MDVAATLFAIEDHATHATEVSCTSQLQQWNKPALKPDACFTVHKDDSSSSMQAYYYTADIMIHTCRPVIEWSMHEACTSTKNT